MFGSSVRLFLLINLKNMKYRKGTFIVVPNRFELQGKPPEMQTLHFWLCHFASDEGSCFPSRPTLAKACGFKSVRTVDKYMEMLVDGGFIGKKKRKSKNGKTNNSNLYQIRVLNAPPSANDDTTPSAPNSTVTISNLTISTKDVTSVKTDTPTKLKKKERIPFVFREELKKLENSTWKPNKIIALFFKRKGYVFENWEQWDAEYGRSKVSAISLQGYTGLQIDKTMDFCEVDSKKNDYDWKLTTVGKKITGIVNKK